MLTFPVTHFGDGVALTGFLDDTVPSVCGQIDATIAASIANNSPVSEKFLNLIALPPDGSSQFDGDWSNGLDDTSTDGDELALSGLAGLDTNFLSTDGAADLSQIMDGTTSGAIALNEAHRNDVDGTWLAFTFRYEDIGNGQWLFGNRNPGALGFSLETTASNVVRIIIDGGLAGQIISTSATLVDGTDNLIIVSWNGVATTNNVKFWVNSDTVTTTNSETLQANTTSTTKMIGVGAQVNLAAFMGSNSRIYGWSWGNEFFNNDTIPTKIRTWYNDNHAGERY